MGDRHQRRRPERDAGTSDAATVEGGEAENAFDLWLRRGLHRLYDGVAEEPLPPELLAMIEADRLRRRDQ